MADWAAAAAAWAQSGEGEKNELVPPPQPPPASSEQQQQQQQSGAWGSTEQQQQQQMWMSHQMDPALAAQQGQHPHGFGPGPGGSDPMAEGGHQGFAHGGTVLHHGPGSSGSCVVVFWKHRLLTRNSIQPLPLEITMFSAPKYGHHFKALPRVTYRYTLVRSISYTTYEGSDRYLKLVARTCQRSQNETAPP